MKKKITAALLAFVMLFALAACGSTAAVPETTPQPAAEEAPVVNVTNDALYDLTEQEQGEKTGFYLTLPADASEVQRNVLLASTKFPLAEIKLTINEVPVCLRVQMASVTTYDRASCDISGLFYSWESETATTVSYCPAWIYSCSEAAYIAWLDAVPGIVYNLCATSPVDAETLTLIANRLFVPVQAEEAAADLSYLDEIPALLDAIAGVGPGSAGSSLRSAAAGGQLMDFAEALGSDANTLLLHKACEDWYTEHCGGDETQTAMFAECWTAAKEQAEKMAKDPASNKRTLADSGYELQHEEYSAQKLEYVINIIESVMVATMAE